MYAETQQKMNELILEKQHTEQFGLFFFFTLITSVNAKHSTQNSLACFFLSITSVNVTHSFISKVTPKLSKKNSAFIFAQIVGRIPIFKLKMCRINQVLCTVIHKKMQISENFVHLLALDQFHWFHGPKVQIFQPQQK